MAVPFFMTAGMAAVIYFFVISMNALSLASWLWGLFLLTLFALMMFTGKTNTYRRIFLVTFALLFAVSFIGHLYDERGSMAITSGSMINSEIPFCHLTIPQVIIPFLMTGNVIFPARLSGHYASVASILFIWLLATLTLGRGWCSWVCFYGGWDDLFSGTKGKPKINLLSRNKDIRSFQFGFLVFIILISIAFMSAVYCQWFCPFKLVTEFSPITDIKSLIEGVMFIGIFVILVVILPILTKKRTQCGALCPFGAMASLTDRISMYKVVIDTEKCTGCMKCAAVCPFFAIDTDTIQNKKGKPEITCAKCGKCIDICPQKAIRYEWRFVRSCSTSFPAEGSTARKILDPANFFRFAAYTFGVIMSSKFAVDAVVRITHAAAEAFIKISGAGL